MKAGELITEWVAPIFGVLIANLMFSTPFRAVMKARKERTLGDLNPVPWAAITCNCMAWIGYSYFKRDWFVFLANQPGLLLGVFYTLSAVGIASKRTQDTIIGVLLLLSFVLPTTAVVLTLPLHSTSEDKKSMVWGLLCNFILVVYYSAPLTTLVTVVRTKSASSLHWPSCLMNFVNGTCWVAYGFAIKDYFILSPNVAGMFLSTVQLFLVFLYRESDAASDGSGLISTRSFFFPSKERASGMKPANMNRSDSAQKLVTNRKSNDV